MVRGNGVRRRFFTLLVAALVVLALAVVAGALPPENTTAPTISDTSPVVGQTLTGSDGSWNVDPDETGRVREWLRGATVVGSGPTYLVTAGDAGAQLVYRVTVTNDDGSTPASSAPTAAVRQAPASSSPPTINNTTPIVGQVLTASPGSWVGTPAPSFSYQWFRAATPVGSAQQYTVVQADAGQTLFVRVTGTNTAGSASADSAATAQVAGPPFNTGDSGTVLPSIPGNPTVGQAVTAVNGTWGGWPVPTTFTYQWQRCDAAGNNCANVNGATAQSYTPVDGDAVAAGYTLRVLVTATNPSGQAQALSPPSQIVRGLPKNAGQPGTVLPSIAEATADNVWVLGEQLTANPGAWLGYPLPTSASPQGSTFAFQWLRCNRSGLNTISTTCAPIGGATGQSYVLTQADVGLGIRVAVVATNVVGSSPPATDPAAVASPLAQARIVNGPPVADGQNGTATPPAVSGTAARGQQLIAGSGVWGGYPVPAVTHQWWHCPTATWEAICQAIGGPTSVAASSPVTAPLLTTGNSAYTLTNAELGRYVIVRATATNTRGTTTATSPATAQVVGAPILTQLNGAPDPNALPKIVGGAVSGLTVAASPGSWSAFPVEVTFTYQWLRCTGTTVADCSPIAGATNDLYKLVDADVGKRIRVRVTASNGIVPNGIAESAAAGPVASADTGGGGDGPDLLVQLSSATAGGEVTFIATVRNVGAGASAATLTASLTSGLTLQSASASQGSCSGAVTCALGGIASGGSATVTIVARAGASGSFSFTASVASTPPDVNPTNNSVTVGTFLSVSSRTPTATASTARPGSGPGGPGKGGSAKTKRVVPKLEARLVKGQWVVDTTFSLLSGAAKLSAVVTEDGSTKPLSVLAGSRLGTTRVGAKGAAVVTLNARAKGTFPLRIVLPSKGFSLQKSYVIRITATAASGASSTLDLGFRGVSVTKRTAKVAFDGKGFLVAASVKVPRDKARIPLRAWVTKGSSAARQTMLLGSRLGTAVQKRNVPLLTFAATKPGTYPVRVLLPAGSLSPGVLYVLRVDSRPRNAAWTTTEIRFKPTRAVVAKAARAIASAGRAQGK
jgi:uncharacterized repeat protein (TIGR01451 family)